MSSSAATGTGSVWRLGMLSGVFFISQIFQEICNEAAVSSFPLAPRGTPVFYTLCQFASVIALALFVKLITNKDDASATSAGVASGAEAHLGAADSRARKSDDDDDEPMTNETIIISTTTTTTTSTLLNKYPFYLWIPILVTLMFTAAGLPNIAARYVSYPVKVVFKSSKLIPTMFVSVFLGNHTKFSFLDYLSAFLLCFGAAGFAYSPGKNENHHRPLDDNNDDDNNEEDMFPAATETITLYQSFTSLDDSTQFAIIGLFLLSLSIIADAFLSNTQQLLMRNGVTSEQLLVWVNGIGALAIFFILTITGDLRGVFIFTFAGGNENLFFLCIAGGICTGFGIYSYMTLIKEGGSVLAVGVATIRKIVTVLLSFLLFPKDFTFRHFFCFIAVVVALGIQYKKETRKK